jgi:hypothetical protein
MGNVGSMKSEETNVTIEDPKQVCLPHGQLLAALALLALVCCLAIDNQSFWMDEATSGLEAQQPTLAEWYRAVQGFSSDLLLPLYPLFIWAWEKLVGLNEFALRAGNALWFLLGLITILRALAGTPLLRWSFLLVLLSSPFAWFYLNEARHYASQIALSLVVFAALYRLGLNRKEPAQERRWVITLCLGSLLLAANSILAMLWLGAYLGAAVLSASRDQRRRLALDYRVYWGLTLTLLFALGLFYLRLLSRGARAIVGPTDVRNVMFVAYELLGFSGLGPGRLAIRLGGLREFWPWLPWLAIYGVTLLIVLTQGWKQIAAVTSRRTRVCWVVALAIVAGYVMGVGVVAQWRALGRHCAPMLVPVLFVLGAGVAALLRRGKWEGRVVAVAFVGLNLVSDLNLRFSERHAKEDYRTAAAIAITATTRGERVWWCGDTGGGAYYGVPLSQGESAPAPGQVWVVTNPTEHSLASQPPPQLVILSSRPDYDREGRLRAYLERGHYNLSQTPTAFTVWRR